MSDWTEIINIDGADWAMRSIDGADWVMRSEATAKVRMLKAERDRLRAALVELVADNTLAGVIGWTKDFDEAVTKAKNILKGREA